MSESNAEAANGSGASGILAWSWKHLALIRESAKTLGGCPTLRAQSHLDRVVKYRPGQSGSGEPSGCAQEMRGARTVHGKTAKRSRGDWISGAQT
ncbi:hypothetical protein NDU88_004420 [Pleurodeles waltl]|uniref:Uncharacterized protein n=1 Tax=Pleurodeles waltl TaxID=8319 RepID=A0AAV7V166_PLEWA|nr:hypothetical protein NDU88_004420 [Pleurodeles waltl]